MLLRNFENWVLHLEEQQEDHMKSGGTKRQEKRVLCLIIKKLNQEHYEAFYDKLEFPRKNFWQNSQALI